jgi:hypothetical protein
MMISGDDFSCGSAKGVRLILPLLLLGSCLHFRSNRRFTPLVLAEQKYWAVCSVRRKQFP